MWLLFEASRQKTHLGPYMCHSFICINKALFSFSSFRSTVGKRGECEALWLREDKLLALELSVCALQYFPDIKDYRIGLTINYRHKSGVYVLQYFPVEKITKLGQ